MVGKIDSNNSKQFAQAHDDLVERFAEGFKYNVGALDKQIVYIAAGTLGLSMTFVSDLVDLRSAYLLPLLVGSWISLVGAIVTNLAGFRFVTALKYQKESLDIAKQMTGMPPYDDVGPNPEAGRDRVSKGELWLELYHKWS